MNSTHASSKVNKAKGKVKEEIGHMTSNQSLASKGVKDQVKGKIQESFANAKDAVKKVVDNFLEDKETKTTKH